jgi:hypothetical protein
MKEVLHISKIINGFIKEEAKQNKVNEELKKTIKVYGIPMDRDIVEKSFTDKINDLRNDLLVNVSKQPKYKLLFNQDITYKPIGNKNKCETNVYLFIKEKLSKGMHHFYPMGGYMFVGNFTPIEHWWIYDQKNNEYLEITPIGSETAKCYAGIINFDIQNDILNSNNVFDVNFFKGGHVYRHYFI